MKDSTSRQIDKKVTKQVRIDAGLHRLVKIHAAQQGETIRELLERCLVEVLGEKLTNES